MNEFKTYHPIVNFTYFGLVIILSCIIMHPICIAISLFCGSLYSVLIGGSKRLKFNFLFILPLMIAAALINPAFNHGGVTILRYLPNGNPLTLESIVFGIAAAGILGSVICHFYCYTEVMTSDKFIYIFGRIIPSLSLILSMILNFIPKFKTQLSAVSSAQKCINKDLANGNILDRTKNGMRIISIMLTWALESTIDTSDSMKSRGYGLPHRTAFSNFKFDKRDKLAMITILLLGVYIIIGYITHAISYTYLPYINIEGLSPWGISILTAYMMLCSVPIIIEIWEDIKWKSSRQKI